MGSHRRVATLSAMRVGVGRARAARSAGFVVEHTHPAEHARFASIVFPTRRARGNSSLAGLNEQLLLLAVHSAQKH